MKKVYKTPTMRVRAASPVQMLCLSVGEPSQGSRYNDPDYDYIEGDSGSGYGYGVPD